MWSTLLFLCGLFFVYTVDRAFLGLLAIPIQQETGIGDLQFGVLNSAIFWSYALCVPFAGLVGDRFDRRKVIGVAAVLWSVMTLLAGFAGGFWSLLLLVSVAITVPQTFYGPAANPLIAETYGHVKTTAMSLHQAAFYSGWFASGAVVAALLSLFGSWRSAYFVFGTLGIVLGLVFLLRASRKPNPVHLAIEQSINPVRPAIEQSNNPVRPAIEQSNNPNNRTIKQSLLAFFACPSALLAASGYVLMVFVACGYCAWGPKFVAQKFSLSPAAAGTGVMFWHYAAAFVSILLAGVATDRFVRRWPRFRLALQVSVLVLAAPLLTLFGLAPSVTLTFAAAAAYGLLRGLFEANQFMSIFDVVPPAFRASAIGFTNVLAGTIGALSPVILGALSQKQGVRGLETGFSLLGLALLLAAGLMSISLFFTFRKDHDKEIVNA